MHHEFELVGIKFRNNPLPPDRALRVLDLLSEKILPVLSVVAGSEIDESKIFAQISRAAGALPDVYATFAQSSEFYRVQSSGGPAAWVPVATFPEVFHRRPALLLAWISHSLQGEFSDFFSENGRSLIGEAVSAWTSLMGSIGGSGDSSVMSESPKG